MVTLASVVSFGLGVTVAVASPARASAEYLRSALVMRTGGISAATAISPAVSRSAQIHLSPSANLQTTALRLNESRPSDKSQVNRASEGAH